jgi:hypothetical protein
MYRTRPVGILLTAIWFFLAGLLAAGSGAGHAFAIQTFFGWMGIVLPGMQTYQTFFILIGSILLVCGIAYWVVAVGLLQGREWGRVYGIVVAALAGLAWIGMGGVLIFLLGTLAGLTPAIVYIAAGLLNLLPILYLISQEAREWCGGAVVPLPPTVPVTPPPPTIPATPPPPVPPTVPPQAPPTPSMRPPRQPTVPIGVPPAPEGWLVLRSGPRTGQQFALKRGRNTIGRDPSRADIVLDDETVSGAHAVIQFEQGQFYIYDLASLNGTYVNNRRVQKQLLMDGDVVRFGNAQAIFKRVS